MWDFLAKNMWDVGFFKQKYVGCMILRPPYKPPSLMSLFGNIYSFYTYKYSCNICKMLYYRSINTYHKIDEIYIIIGMQGQK